jgi:hypothetical protein
MVCECGEVYRLEERQLRGLAYEVYVCPKCQDTIFTMEQARAYRQVHALADVAARLEPLTLRHVGHSVNATVPKELAELGFAGGRKFRWEIESPTRITLHLIGGAGPPSTSKAPTNKRSRSRKRLPHAPAAPA